MNELSGRMGSELSGPPARRIRKSPPTDKARPIIGLAHAVRLVESERSEDGIEFMPCRDRPCRLALSEILRVVTPSSRTSQYIIVLSVSTLCISTRDGLMASLLPNSLKKSLLRNLAPPTFRTGTGAVCGRRRVPK